MHSPAAAITTSPWQRVSKTASPRGRKLCPEQAYVGTTYRRVWRTALTPLPGWWNGRHGGLKIRSREG